MLLSRIRTSPLTPTVLFLTPLLCTFRRQECEMSAPSGLKWLYINQQRGQVYEVETGSNSVLRWDWLEDEEYFVYEVGMLMYVYIYVWSWTQEKSCSFRNQMVASSWGGEPEFESDLLKCLCIFCCGWKCLFVPQGGSWTSHAGDQLAQRSKFISAVWQEEFYRGSSCPKAPTALYLCNLSECRVQICSLHPSGCPLPPNPP